MSEKNNLKPCPFCKGDILLNLYAGKGNPFRYVMFLECGTIRQGRYRHKSYDCIGYDGTKHQFFRDDNQFVKVGHMYAFDAFVAALDGLRDIEKEEQNNEN